MSCTFPKADIPRIHLRETDSTQTALRQALNDSVSSYDDPQNTSHLPLPEFFTITADYQLAGHGQCGTYWESQPGANLLMSTLLRPSFLSLDRQFMLSKAIALSLIHTLQKLAPTHTFHIKWPNDIYHGNRKICGIIIQNDLAVAPTAENGEPVAKNEEYGTPSKQETPTPSTSHSPKAPPLHIQHALVGIGLNLNQQTFTSSAPNPISLIHLLGHSTPIVTAQTLLLRHLRAQYDRLRIPSQWSQIVAEYHTHLHRNDDQYHPYQDQHGLFHARIQEVSPNGMLTLMDRDGNPRPYTFKEVSYIYE